MDHDDVGLMPLDGVALSERVVTMPVENHIVPPSRERYIDPPPPPRIVIASAVPAMHEK